MAHILFTVSMLAHIINFICTSAGDCWNKVASVVLAAILVIFPVSSDCANTESTFEEAPESAHVVINIPDLSTDAETQQVDGTDVEPSFVITIEPAKDFYACAGLDAETIEPSMASTVTSNDSSDETAIDIASTSESNPSDDARSEANTECSGYANSTMDKVAMAIKTRSVVRSITTSSCGSLLDCAYASINMHKILPHRPEFFCWTDAVFEKHFAHAYAALSVHGSKAAKTKQLLDKLNFYHDMTFSAAQAMSEHLLAQRRPDGLTSQELRQIFKTIYCL
ncbi:hypothetical protein GGI03_002697 [Coemansia sp. RSA 2337]|nr:hypothetical protein H4S04_002238 [Coemansia sp. S16]KAJ2353582.1 hypothetical protein GGH92_000569 [Coemansia sp. RSA 2673]KAJ2465379.1 hypothetical protein GGI03_002697 [Coemansia sp. RSA 2337]